MDTVMFTMHKYDIKEKDVYSGIRILKKNSYIKDEYVY